MKDELGRSNPETERQLAVASSKAKFSFLRRPWKVRLQARLPRLADRMAVWFPWKFKNAKRCWKTSSEQGRRESELEWLARSCPNWRNSRKRAPAGWKLGTPMN